MITHRVAEINLTNKHREKREVFKGTILIKINKSKKDSKARHLERILFLWKNSINKTMSMGKIVKFNSILSLVFF